MTNDQMQAIRDDLAYMRALADEGRRTPLLGGSILIAAGLIYGAAALAHWAVITDVLAVGLAGLNVIWGVAVAAFFAALFVLKARLGGKPGAAAMNNKVSAAAWGGMGGASFAIALSLFAAVYKTGDWIFMGLFPPVIFALYGAAWIVGSALSDAPWMRWVAVASFGAAVASGLLIGTAEQYLVYAAAFFLLSVVPGIALTRQEPAEVV
ncbi:MAG TPA: hypothetical protein VF699_02685 [Caulobacteraceae bacterium]